MALRRATIALGLGLLLGLPLAQFAIGDAPPCAPLVELPGVGPACPRQGGYDLVLPDGSVVFTHGPDPFPQVGSEVFLAPPFPVAVPPACTGPSTTLYRGVLVYARAADRPDRSAQMGPVIADMFLQANTHVARESLSSGAPYRFRMLCDGDALVVKHAVLPTPAGQANPGTIFGDLQALGYTSIAEKYWVWYDGYACWCAGIATIDNDARPLPTNVNNRGPDWALTFGVTGTWGWLVMLHEAGHNLGAVQLATPNASGGWHCNDGWDVMCYADGGSTSNYNHFVCGPLDPGLPRWDCNNDDYSASLPVWGDYLATAWNVASPVNRFVTPAV
jgi:hypothetical protein